MDDLKQIATNVLRKAGSVDAALKPFAKAVFSSAALKESLLRTYLESVAAVGQKALEAQECGADPVMRVDPGHMKSEAQSANAESTRQEGARTGRSLKPSKDVSAPLPPSKPVTVVRHHRAMPGAGLAAKMLVADAIFDTRRIDGQSLRTIRYEQMGKIAADLTANAASYLRLGTQSIEDAILMRLIWEHGTPADTRMTAPEIVSAAQTEAFADEARRLAPVFVEEHMRRITRSIENVKEIGHAA